MTRDEIDALVARAMATRCGGCDDVDHRTQDALCAEIERLRALPVVTTCGECGYRSSRLGSEIGAVMRVCTNVYPPRETDYDAAPPGWCPLRGKR